MITKIVGAVGTFFLILFLLIIAFGSWGTIPAGSRGVVLDMGKVTGEIKPEGFYTKTPWLVTVVKMNIQTKKEEVTTQAASKDLQTVTATVSLNLRPLSDKVAFIYQNIGTDYLNVMVAPAMQEGIKSVIARFTAEELVTNREIVRQGISDLIAKKLQPIGLETEAVNIVDFDFSKNFNEAIEAKVTAEQNALAARNKLEQTKYEADQRVAAAKGEAEAISIQAQAIQNQGGAAYIQLKALELWDGKMPVYITSGATTPFINIK